MHLRLQTARWMLSFRCFFSSLGSYEQNTSFEHSKNRKIKVNKISYFRSSIFIPFAHSFLVMKRSIEKIAFILLSVIASASAISSSFCSSSSVDFAFTSFWRTSLDFLNAKLKAIAGAIALLRLISSSVHF